MWRSTSPSCRLVTVQRHEKPCLTKCVFAGASYCTVMEIQQSRTLHWPHLQYCRHKVFGSCRRCDMCEQLQSLNEEYYVLSLLDVLLAQQRVRRLSCTQHVNYPPLPFSLSLTSLSHNLLSRFSMYTVEGHQFSVQTHNKLLLSWATQVNYCFDLVFFWPLPLYSFTLT